MEKKCPTKKLLEYLQNADKYSEMPKNLQQHAKECVHCRKILENPKRHKAFIVALTCEDTPGDKIARAKKPSEISKIKPGQLWQINIAPTKENILAIATSELIVESELKAVRIVPICTTHSEKDTDETDMFLLPSEMPLGLPCLVQWWNDRPVLLTQLKHCYGDLSPDATKKLLKKIKISELPKNLSPSGRLFRQIEINKGTVISAPLFGKMLMPKKEKSYDKIH